MVRIEIHQTFAKIGIDRKPAEIRLKQESSPLELEIAPASLEIRGGYSDLQIDQSACFSDMGLKGFWDRLRDNREISEQAALDGIARIVEEGNQLGNIEQRKSVGDVARAKDDAKTDFNVTLVPSHRPSISFTFHPLQITSRQGEIKNHTRPWQLDITVIPGYIRMYLIQYPSLEIKTLGYFLDKKI